MSLWTFLLLSIILDTDVRNSYKQSQIMHFLVLLFDKKIKLDYIYWVNQHTCYLLSKFPRHWQYYSLEEVTVLFSLVSKDIHITLNWPGLYSLLLDSCKKFPSLVSKVPYYLDLFFANYFFLLLFTQ